MNSWLKTGLVLFFVLAVGAVVWEQLGGLNSGVPAGIKVEPDLVVKDIDGKDWTLRQEAGHPVLISFFATWCSPCRDEFPHLVELKNRYANRGVQLIMVTQEDAATASTMHDMRRQNLRLLVDAQRLHDDFGVDGIPHAFVIDGKGKVTASAEGFDPELSGIKSLEAALLRALDAK